MMTPPTSNSASSCYTIDTTRVMPLSLKKQRKCARSSNAQHDERKKGRKLAAELLADSSRYSLRAVSQMTGVPRNILTVLKRSLAFKDKVSLKELTSPQKKPGAQPVLTFEEERLIVAHCLKAATRGFALREDDLKGIMGRIASDGRGKGYKIGVPSSDAVRSFRARHPELTFRKVENKSAVKLRGENYFHVKTYEDVLRSVNEEHTNIFDDGDCVWNMDETHVDGEFGKRERVISSSNTHHGGFCVTTAGTGNGRHVTVVIAVSASGRQSPPFYIIEGKRNMSNWYLSLSEAFYDFTDGSLKRFTRKNWFNAGACVLMGENGSMTQEIIPLFMKHLNAFVRTFVPAEKHYVLLLDGHSSRNGLDWLEYATTQKCVVVQSPANTSHVLQPCDQDVNKRFGDTVRRVRDKFCLASKGVTDTRTIQTKLMLSTAGLEAITSTDIRRSWDTTGLWPMDYRFTEKFKRNKDEMALKAAQEIQAAASAGPAAALKSVRQRRSDRETYEALAAIVDAARQDGCVRVSSALQNASVCLNNHQTVNNILMMKERSTLSTANTRVSNNHSGQELKTKNIPLSAGAPAQYLTHKDLLEKRRQAVQAEKMKQKAKAAAATARAEKRKQNAANKKTKAKLKPATNIRKPLKASKVVCRLRLRPNAGAVPSADPSLTEIRVAMALTELEGGQSRG